jgi:hypothetical protein
VKVWRTQKDEKEQTADKIGIPDDVLALGDLKSYNNNYWGDKRWKH